ncbi:glycosyltransferase family 2 protein [Pseudomonas marincola]|nr:glycosyltransferase family 2 protein [Pseudomonas marincola]
MENFSVPVVLFLFKRVDKPLEIMNQIAKIKPTRIYLLSDGGRDPGEKALVEQCRVAVEQAINWECEIVRKYEANNVGVYRNIAEGAKWVFEREEFAIFLEDDNYPELSFFRFCEELLLRYKEDRRVLWICGTNYLESYIAQDGASYVFTKNMMPCGWASWRDKFIDFYDGDMDLWRDKYIRTRIKEEYHNQDLYYQDSYNLDYEIDFKKKYDRYYSWDYQMALAMRVHNVCAIVPTINQIKNIGADSDSTHGGSDIQDLMVERFCGLQTSEISFPLKHPKSMLIDIPFEVQVSKIILNPNFNSLRSRASRGIRKLFDIDRTESIYHFITGVLFKSFRR